MTDVYHLILIWWISVAVEFFSRYYTFTNNEITIFETKDKTISILVNVDSGTVWLSLDQMTSLFQRDKSTVSRHINKIFNQGELVREAVVAKYATTATDGKTYQVDFFNLDVIISVDYRVKSQRGTFF